MTTAHDIFISYAREDRAAAERFAAGFSAAGLSVWWDSALQAGESFDLRIEEAIKAAKGVVVLWSEHSVKSRWVRAEATLADRLKKLLPVRISPCELPIMFELTHTAELTGWNGAADDKAWQSFLGDIRRIALKAPEDQETSPVAAAAAAPPLAPPARGNRPTLAILPFTNRSGDAADNIFASGLVEDIIAALSLASGARVLSQSATAPYRKEAIDLKRIGEELGVRYVLEGNLRRAGQALRVTAQLVEAASGQILWTQMFARPLSELAELQDDLVTELAGHLGAAVQRLEIDRALKKPGGWTAWEAVARSISYFSRFDAQSQQAGIDEARRAVALAPDYALAQANLAHFVSAVFTLSLDEASAAEARAAVERALALDRDNPTVLWKCARALASIGLSGEALPLVEQSIALMPLNAIAHGTRALALTHLGRPRDAMASFDEESRLAPRAHGQFFTLTARAFAHLMLGEHADALAAAEKSLKIYPGYVLSATVKAAAAAAIGDDLCAREALLHCRRIDPEHAVPEFWERSWRRLMAPEGFALLGPALAAYRRTWDVMPA